MAAKDIKKTKNKKRRCAGINIPPHKNGSRERNFALGLSHTDI
jgi:hypothetical protein